jgi:predicted nuclease with RNAse H fold
MRTVGIDLAAEPKGTAVAHVEWAPGGATVHEVVVGADDDRIVAAVESSDKAGIDCPLGWPAAFIEFVTDHSAHALSTPDGVGKDRRRELAYRATDRFVYEQTRKWPLSVATDRIAHTAMRAAGLLSRLARSGQPVDRTGAGVVVEVYPAASLRRWGLTAQGYKGTANVTALGGLVDALRQMAPWLHFGEHEEVCRRSDHAFDAVVAALAARAAKLGLVTAPDAEQAKLARTEGWIALPKGELHELLT